MTHLRRSPVLILALIALLAACSSADTSSASSAAPAATAAALVRGEFVGDAGDLAGIALSTNGRQVIGYLCDRTGRGHVPAHPLPPGAVLMVFVNQLAAFSCGKGLRCA
jgi:hypothetical protein